MYNSLKLTSYLLIHIIQLVLMVSSKLIPNTNLCQICDRSSPKTNKGSTNPYRATDDCYKYGVYDVFCHPKYNRNRTIDACESFFSIYPPSNSKNQCNVNIFDNHGNIQDIITLAPDGSVSSTNNSWHITPRMNTNSFYYGIAKRITSQKHFEGKQS